MLTAIYIGLGGAYGMFIIEYYARIKELDFFETKIASLQDQVSYLHSEIEMLKFENERFQATMLSTPGFSLGPMVSNVNDGQRQSAVKFQDTQTEMRFYTTPSVWRRRSAALSQDNSSVDLSQDNVNVNDHNNR